MQELRLKEHEVTRDVPLTSDEVRWLRESDAGLTVLGTGRPGVFDVKASERVGALVGARRTVVIEPKVPVANLLFMMGGDADLGLGPAANMAADASMVELMARLYADLLEQSIRDGGLVATYEERREEQSAPRGRIDWLAVQTRRFGLFPPISCVACDLQLDTELNRRLLAALVAMTRITSGETITRLRRVLGHFVGVSERRYGVAPLTPVHVDRRTARFAAALAFAEAILRSFSVSLHLGTVPTPSFLIDMNDVFERFVVRELNDSFIGTGGRVVHHPEGIFLDRRRWLTLKPDGVLFLADGTAQAAIDAKYKNSGVGYVEDAYQAFAYCTALGTSRGLLVYANARDVLHEIVNSSVSVVVVGLDLSDDPHRVRARLREVAARLVAPVFVAA